MSRATTKRDDRWDIRPTYTYISAMTERNESVCKGKAKTYVHARRASGLQADGGGDNMRATEQLPVRNVETARRGLFERNQITDGGETKRNTEEKKERDM